MELKKERLKEALGLLRRETPVLVPMRDGEDIFFRPWDGHSDPCLEGRSTLPPKDALFPKTEKMYRYRVRAGEIEEIAAGGAQVIFGIRPCDVNSVGRMDQVFLTRGYVDSYYSARRGETTLICVGCTAPEASCFCDSMGGDPTHADGADVQMNDLGGAFRVEARSERGEAVLKAWADLLTEEGGEAPSQVSCTLKIRKPENLPALLERRFEDPVWERAAEACLGCGCCTFVCPTCYCFDISQEVHGAEGAALRCWDSCMFSDYSRLAGGQNPRPTKRERLRNRYMHKLAYFDERYDQTLCVGCGRCVERCPAHLDITAFIERIGKEEG